MATVSITSSNISKYFTVTNSSYYFSGSGETFTSNNNGIHSSSAKTELTALYDFTTVSFNYSYSSESSYDKLTIKVGSTTVANALSGVGSSSWSGSVSKGTVISFTYSKDRSTNSNDDKCTFSAMKVTSASIANPGLYVGVDGKARKTKNIYVGVNGKARKVLKGYVGVNGVARLFYKYELEQTQWIFTSNGTFTVPVTGTYTIELHGGGGGGGSGSAIDNYSGGGGGGSGEKWENVQLTKGTQYTISIGKGGSTGKAGGTTSFGSLYSISGGGGGSTPSAGSKSGSLASAGTRGVRTSDEADGGAGGSGGCSVPGYTAYGNGGNGGKIFWAGEHYGGTAGGMGMDGIAIITITNY